jgi:hypothetical protein
MICIYGADTVAILHLEVASLFWGSFIWLGSHLSRQGLTRHYPIDLPDPLR